MMVTEMLLRDFSVEPMPTSLPNDGACYHVRHENEFTVPVCMDRNIQRMLVDGDGTTGEQQLRVPCLVLLDGRCVGTHPDGYELVWALRMQRRKGGNSIAYSMSVAHSHDMRAVYIGMSFGRVLQPLLVVDHSTQRVLLQKKDLGRGIGWLVRHGYLEFLDEHEIDTLTVAMMVGDLHNWDERGGPFSHVVPHPALQFSTCGNAGSFLQHVMSVRNTVHAGMAKQSMGGMEHPNGSSVATYNLWYPQRPLVANRITYVDHGMYLMPSQQQCVIAVTNTEARNATDAITVNQAALDRGLMHSTFMFTVRAVECTGDINGVPDPRCTDGYRHGRYAHIRPGEFIVRPGCKVNVGDVLLARYTVVNQAQTARGSAGNNIARGEAEQRLPSTDDFDAPLELGQATLYRDTSVLVPMQHAGVAYVHSVRITPVCHSVTFSSQTTTQHILHGTFGKRSILSAQRYEIVLRQDIPGEPGNKIVIGSSTSAKGVLTTPMSPEDMPYSIRTGMQPDILVNPLAFTRLMMGLLYELIQGKAQTMRGGEEDGGDQTFIDRLPGWEGTPFTKKNLRAWVNTLRKHGYDGMGLEQMADGKTGVPMEGLTCMGVVPICVLHHVCSKKSYARGDKGPNNARVRSPMDGRKSHGALRIGEQEVSMIVRHGMAHTLQRLIPGRSDGMLVMICMHCGLLMFTDPGNATKFHCPLEKYLGPSVQHIPRSVVLPYSMLVLINELFVMGVLIQLNPTLDRDTIEKADINAFDMRTLRQDRPTP